MKKRLVFAIFTTGLMVIAVGIASGQSYPAKPIRIVTSEAASGSDFAARLIGQGISGPLGQPVIIDNRPAGVIQGEVVAKAAPDGYTVLVTGSSFWLQPFLKENLSWDPVRDFLPVTLAARAPNILVVHPSLRVNSVRELIQLARNRPGELNYASGATLGGSPHLAVELFKAMAGVKIARISYKGTGTAINDLIGGQVQMMVATTPSASQHVKSGRLRALGVTSAEPSVLVPGLPTVAASGLPGYVSVSITGVFVPAKTPADIVQRLNQEMVQALARPNVRERFFNLGVEAVGTSPDELAATINSEMSRMGKVIKDAGIRAD